MLKDTLKALNNCDTVITNNKEVLHPSIIIQQMESLGEIKVAKYQGEKKGIKDFDNENPISLFNKYLIEVKVDDKNSDMYGTLGIIVEQNKNIFQVYSGLTAHACLNLTIWGADYIKKVKTIDFSNIVKYLDSSLSGLATQEDFILSQLEFLKNKVYSKEEFTKRKGVLLEKMNPVLFPYLLHAEEQFREKTSLYYDQPSSDFNLLAAMTDKISKEGVNSRVAKTLQLEKLFI